MQDSPCCRRFTKVRKDRRRETTDDYEVCPITVAFKIYKNAFEESHYRRIEDGSFFDAKRTWERLLKDLDVAKTAERRLRPYEFEKGVRRVSEKDAGVHGVNA